MVKYWKIGFTMGGGGDVWEEFVEQGLASIGWGWKLGDLREYKDQLEMYEEWKRLKCDSKRAFYQLWHFYRSIQPRDKVVAYGRGRIRGSGTVIGEYDYRHELEFPHVKPVEWTVPFEPIKKLPKRLKSKLKQNITILPLKKREFKTIEKLIKKSEKERDFILYAPKNELEIIFLFGCYIKKFGFDKIKKISSQMFPDAIAIDSKGKQVGIEFELFSSAAKTHERKYGSKGFKKRCNLIVCWEDDWKEEFDKKCPVKVLELKSRLKKARRR